MPLWDAKGENLNSFTKEVAKLSPQAASLPKLLLGALCSEASCFHAEATRQGQVTGWV